MSPSTGTSGIHWPPWWAWRGWTFCKYAKHNKTSTPALYLCELLPLSTAVGLFLQGAMGPRGPAGPSGKNGEDVSQLDVSFFNKFISVQHKGRRDPGAKPFRLPLIILGRVWQTRSCWWAWTSWTSGEFSCPYRGKGQETMQYKSWNKS